MKNSKLLNRYGGYILAALLVFMWLSGAVGPVAIIIMSVVVSLYFLLAAPLWCGAINRDGSTLCRRNSRGLLLGCGYRQHKWQKIKLAFIPRGFRRFTNAMFGNAANATASITALLALASAFVGLIKELIA